MILKLTSSINTALKKRTLFRGTFLALLGIFLLIGGGVFLNPTNLEYWGLPLFTASFGLMAFGMIPYRQLCALERKPHLIYLTENKDFQYFKKGKLIFTLPTSAIKTFTFSPGASTYGITLKLKKSSLESFHNLHREEIFFPYFSEKAFKQLIELINVSPQID